MTDSKNIPFQGLSHSPSDYDSQDGELGTCLNLINEDGALRTIPKPVLEENFTLPLNCEIKLVHKVSHNNGTHTHYIIYDSSAKKFSWIEKGASTYKYSSFSLGSAAINAVTAIGNIICFVSDSRTIYAYWNGSDYIMFDISDLHYSISISSSFVQESIYTYLYDDWDTAFKGDSTPVPTLKGAGIIFNALDAMTNKVIDTYGDDYFKYISFGVAAIRLYDGTYINISNPFVLSPENLPNKFFYVKSLPNIEKAVISKASIHKHTLKIDCTVPNGLEDLIQGIDVFVTPCESFIDTTIAPRKIKNEDYPYDPSEEFKGFSAAFSFKTPDKLYDTIDNLPFYLSGSIDRKNFGSNVTLKRVQQTETSLQLADFKQSSYGGKCAVTYNNRLHIANIKTTFLNTFKNSFSESFDVSNANNVYINNCLDIDNPRKKFYDCNAVFHVGMSQMGFKTDLYYSGTIQYPLPPILSFPSDKATEMEIFLYNSKYSKYYKAKFTLRQSNGIGMAYYVNLGDRYTTPESTNFGNSSDTSSGSSSSSGVHRISSKYYDDSNLPFYIQNKKFNYVKSSDGNYYWSSYSDTNIFTEIAKSEYDEALAKCQGEPSTINSPSLVKVSNAENPLVFSAKDSVQVGSSNIYAMSANTQPISEGQFGEAPLYAFTDEGVWMLMVSQEGSYVSRQPANREVCSNPNAILQIDDAVLYPTDKGIILQRGRNATCITEQLDGYPFDFATMPNAQKVLDTSGITVGVSYERLKTFLDNGTNKADLIYNYYDNRIILFNPSYRYAYVYSLRSKMWGTVVNEFRSKLNAYPYSYGVNKFGQILNVYNKNPTDDVTYFLCSRPLTISVKDAYKTVFSAITRGYFRNSDKGKCGMVLYGSNDLFNWYMVSSSTNKWLRGMAGSPYRYFRIAIIGSLKVDETIQGVSIEYQDRWQNKLR